MEIDSEAIRRQFASLTDEALAAIKRNDLVEPACSIYDEEVKQRKAAHPPIEEQRDPGEDAEPDWTDAAKIFSSVDRVAGDSSQEAKQVLEVLEAAGIPCFLETSIEREEASPASEWKEWRVYVPGDFNQRAMSVIDRDIYNAGFEEEWKNHLERLSNRELRALDPKLAFCGLFDRIERVTRVYKNELERRGLA